MTVDPPVRYGSYRAGHEPHVIQVRLSWSEDPIGEGTASVDADGWITIVLGDDEPIRRWTHDPARLAQVLAAVDGRVELRAKGVLAIAATNGHHVVSVADGPSPCPPPDEDTSDWTPTEHVERRGGFLMRGTDLDAT